MNTWLTGALALLPLGGPFAPAPEPSEPAATSPPVSLAHRVDDASEVAGIVRSTVEKVVTVLRDETLTRDEKRERVMGVIEPFIDFQLLAMLSLGKTHWTRIDGGQREAFTELFVETLKISYFEKLELFTDEVVEFEAPVPIQTKGSPKFSLLTYIVSKGDRIRVAYSVTRREDGWKAYDFEIEGVSIRKSYGSQYADFLRESSFDELLDAMRKKIEEAKEADAARAASK